jgi:hypothetical protein
MAPPIGAEGPSGLHPWVEPGFARPWDDQGVRRAAGVRARRPRGARKHPVGREVLARHLGCAGASARVVGLDLLDGRLNAPERVEAGTERKDVAEAGVLLDGRPLDTHA